MKFHSRILKSSPPKLGCKCVQVPGSRWIVITPKPKRITENQLHHSKGIHSSYWKICFEEKNTEQKTCKTLHSKPHRKRTVKRTRKLINAFLREGKLHKYTAQKQKQKLTDWLINWLWDAVLGSVYTELLVKIFSLRNGFHTHSF